MSSKSSSSVMDSSALPPGLEGERFMRFSLPFLALWLISVVVIGAIAWHYLLGGIEQDRKSAEAAAVREAEILARSYAGHLSQTIDAIDQLSLYVRYGWKMSGSKLDLQTLSDTGPFPARLGLYVTIVNAEGDILTSTLGMSEPINVSEEAYFLAQSSSGSDQLYIGRPRYGILSKRTVTHFSRKLMNGDGRFGGVVVISVVPEYFIAGYDQLTLGPHGLLAILGSDRRVRVARIGDQVYTPPAATIVAPPAIDGRSGTVMLDGATYFSDKRSRYLGWQATERHEMIAVAGIDQQDALSVFTKDSDETILHGIVATSALALFTLLASLSLARLSWRKQQIKQLHDTYRTATERGNDGFFIMRPRAGDDGKISDFKVIDCNEQGARIMKYRRSELIGLTISEIYSHSEAKELNRLLRAAYEKRHLEREIDARKVRTVAADWLHVSIGRPDGDLAVTIRDISQTKAHVAELERIGSEDALTRLPNRHWLKRYLPQALVSARASRQMLALLFIDLDGFKAVNDTMGHEIGDELLRNAGRRLKEAVRPHDIVARIGGDEFIVVTENLAHRTDAGQVAQRILHSFEAPFRLSQGTHSVGTSIGISVFPNDGLDADTLMSHADMAMYAVKMSGKRNYCYFDAQFSESVQRRHQNEVEFRHALEQNQFVIYYQPRIDLATCRMSSMEALVRWAHPERGIIEPQAFIPLAEETGLIIQLGEQVIDKVCAQLAFWLRHGREIVPVSINVSARQFTQSDVAATLADALKRYQLDAHLVEIELTESSMMSSGQDVSEVLAVMQHMGVKLLVDDFGTGYSSLAQLQELDFDTLKVDRAFTARLGSNDASNVFYTAIITMAHSLGMKVVAEGVETEEQVRRLAALRCDEIQGYFVAPPLPPAEQQTAYALNLPD